MSEKDYTDEEIEELDSYIKTEFNHDIYEELNDEDYPDYKNLFEPLEFFRLFYFQIKFIQSNKDKPLFVSRNLKKLEFSDEQLVYLYINLENYFDDETGEDEELNICCIEIAKLRKKI
jgi:hypothetical protein